MKINTTTAKVVAGFATAALLASFTAANAGSPQHEMPTNGSQPAVTYEIKLVSSPNGNHPLTVQVINKESGQPVANADVRMQHWVWGGVKAVPQMQRVLVALDADGHGNYVCTREHPLSSERVTFRAHVPGDTSGMWTTLALNN